MIEKICWEKNKPPKLSFLPPCLLRKVVLSLPSMSAFNETSTPAAKKRKLTDARVVQQWSVDGNVTINVVVLTNASVRVRIVDTSTNVSLEMTSGTFYEFCSNMQNFNFVYSTSSIICNNQLAVFSKCELCVLQQIYGRPGKGFTLKTQCLMFNRFQLQELLETCPRVRECLKETILCHALPESIRGNCQTIDDSNSENFLKAVFDQVIGEAGRLYHCDGCINDHPSQRQHQCVMDSCIEKYQSEGERAIFHMSFKSVCDRLQYYNENMFLNLSVDIFMEAFDKFIVTI